jgi:transposase
MKPTKKNQHEFRYCGIDIAAATIDICFVTEEGIFEYQTLANDKTGFSQLLKIVGKHVRFVMEATGLYHLPLSFYLESKKQHYSVVNALTIKRFIQMHLERNKSDKKDAMHICEYGISNHPEKYQMPDQQCFEAKTLNNAIETITNEITSFKNKIFSLKKSGIKSQAVLKTYEKIIEHLQVQLQNIEQELKEKLEAWQPDLVKLVSSITGIGKRATAILIVQTQGFKFTETYQQLISYAGLSPKEYSSGSSIRGKVRICKQGGNQLRHTLYMCALNAKKTNPQCKALFDRLVAKGKNKKLAVIAVCNKLLKQVFGVVKNQTPYSKNYLENCA